MSTRILNIGQSVLAIVSIALLYSIYIRPARYWRDLDKEIYDTKVLAIAGVVLGLYYGYQFYKNGLSFKANYTLNLVVRFGLSFFLLSYGISKIEDATFSNSILSLGYHVGDLSSHDIVNLFFGYTYGYQATLGWLEIIAAGLLMFRRTYILGALVLTGYFTNMFLVGYFFENPYLFNITIFLFIAISVLLSQGQRLLSVLFGLKMTETVKYPFFDTGSHAYKSMAILKLLFLAGLFAYYLGETRDRMIYTKANQDSPISGVWKVAGLEYKQTDTLNPQNEGLMEHEIGKFDRFFLDEGRYGAVKVADSLSMFEYIIDTNYNQLEFWNFFDFRELDFKGKYEWAGSDTLIYKGLNKRDSLKLILVLDKEYKPLR